MPNIRMLPPASGNKTLNVNGRTYIGVTGTPHDVPDFDAQQLWVNGWVPCGGISVQVGATAARPATPNLGQHFQDTTVGNLIVWDGATWRDSLTGASV